MSAAPHTAPATDWIEWSGGECPVAPDTLVLTMRSGKVPDRTPEQAGWWDGNGGQDSNWNCGGRYQITAYRVVSQ